MLFEQNGLEKSIMLGMGQGIKEEEEGQE